MNNYDWRFENSIQYTKNYQQTEGILEHKYVPWRTNYVLSNFVDTILYANEMNIHHTLDHKLQYDFLFNSIRPKKRFFKKTTINSKNKYFDIIQKYYKYNDVRTKEVLSILTEKQIELIIKSLEEGGT